MCGIIGFLDKRGGHDRPVGRTLLAMLEALSCRGPDSAGVAVFGPPLPVWVVQVKLPEHLEREKATRAVLEALADAAPVIRHEAKGAYLRLEVEGWAEPGAV